MRSPALLVLAAPLVLALPAPAPEPLPLPKPRPQTSTGVETDPITGLLTGLLTGVLNIGSVRSAVPAIISDTAQVVDSTVPILGEEIGPKSAEPILIEIQRQLQTAPSWERIP